MKVSCIVPAYNEESTIAGVLDILKKIDLIDEIIVVDDGSSDKTYEIASKYAKVLKQERNIGKGAAMRAGVKHANGEIIAFFDADLQNIDDSQKKSFERMIRSVKSGNADVVIGTYDFASFQTFTFIVYEPLMRLFFPEVHENIPQGVLSGQRVIRKSILDKISLRDGFDVEAGMNIDMCLLDVPPKFEFVHLGSLNPRHKGYQTSMEIIADCIIDYARRYDRLDKLKGSSFKRVANLLCSKLEKLE